jgi:cytoskeletal protein CcmA (bactofilin family)
MVGRFSSVFELTAPNCSATVAAFVTIQVVITPLNPDVRQLVCLCADGQSSSLPQEVTVLKRDKERVGADFGEIRAFLGEGTQFKGVLSFAGAVRVDGQLEGEIVGDEVLIIGEPGQVKAEIEVGTLVVSGRVQGTITAKQRVELLRPSRVTATIRTPCLVVAEGARFNGNCEMADPDDGKVLRLEPKQEEDLQAAERA